MPKNTKRPLQELLDERARLITEFEARVRVGSPIADADIDQHGDDISELDLAILGRADADASPGDALLCAEHAMSLLRVPEDEPGETRHLDVVAARALRASLLRLAAPLR